MNTRFTIILAIALLVFLIALFGYSVAWEIECRNSGGVPIRDNCLDIPHIDVNILGEE